MKAEADFIALGNPCNIITQAGKSHHFAFSFSRKTNILHQQNLLFVGFSLDSPSGHAAMLPARSLQRAKRQSPGILWESSFEADPESGQIDQCNQTQNPQFWAPQTSYRTGTWIQRIYFGPLGKGQKESWEFTNLLDIFEEPSINGVTEIWFALSIGIFKRLWQVHFLRKLSSLRGQGKVLTWVDKGKGWRK